MKISDNTLILIIVIVLFTITFVSSALITYKIRRKNSGEKEESDKKISGSSGTKG